MYSTCREFACTLNYTELYTICPHIKHRKLEGKSSCFNKIWIWNLATVPQICGKTNILFEVWLNLVFILSFAEQIQASMTSAQNTIYARDQSNLWQTDIKFKTDM